MMSAEINLITLHYVIFNEKKEGTTIPISDSKLLYTPKNKCISKIRAHGPFTLFPSIQPIMLYCQPD